MNSTDEEQYSIRRPIEQLFWLLGLDVRYRASGFV
jgi:hypothetical protein